VTAKTTRVILESAIFHGPTIRSTARRLGLRSEASMRHEKGIARDLPRFAADRAARLIAEITGARVATGMVDNDPGPKPPLVVELDLARTERLLGIGLDGQAAADLIAPLGFVSQPRGGGRLSVTIPGHRLDVAAPEDVAEEIARSYGYDRIPGKLPEAALPPIRPDPSEPRHRVRRILAGLGLDEVVTHALIGPADLARSGYDAGDGELVRVANPLGEAHSIMRPTLYPSLLAALAENVRQRRTEAWIFEVGKTYWMSDRKGPVWAETAGTGRHEASHVGIALLGAELPRSLGVEQREAGVADVKGMLEALHAALGAPPPTFRAESAEERHPHLHRGRAGRLVDSRGRGYGSVGELDPRVAAAWDLPGRPVLAAVNLGQLFELVRGEVRVGAVPAAQPIDRDLAVVLPEATPLGELLRIVRANAGPTLVDARVFDVYRGTQIGPGKVSYAIALRFQPDEPADEKGVERAMNRVKGSVQHHLDAEIR
jgi:phenylalanyl-tRNA synthetase beta chain